MTSVAVAQSATIKFPRLDQRLEHPQPERDATYGWVFTLADVDVPGPLSVADFVIGSMFKNILPSILDAGRAYVHHGPNLGAPDAFNTLSPVVPQAGNEFSRLKVTVGDVRGLATDPGDVSNLVFVPAFRRAMDLSSCSQSAAAPVGAVDVFDMTDADGNGVAYLFTITPPSNPSQDVQVPAA